MWQAGAGSNLVYPTLGHKRGPLSSSIF